MALTKEEEMKVAGIAFFIGIVQFFLFMLLAELVYPDYSVSGNYISDLGVGGTAYIFNTSIVVLGLLIIVTGYFIRKLSRPLLIILILAGIGAMGVGLFPETTGSPHLIFSLIVFLMASIAPYFLVVKIRNLMSVMWAILGTVGLIALILYIPGIYLGLGHGGMERMIVYPDLLWGIGFGGWLIGNFSGKHVTLDH
ncbi:MAG: hypothetical protein B2I17_08620 [Thermoplasmatales archaeon B_DKE]|nr:MAG: hypothetical protein B2I17_08620 [Thermoplasmatales archaeon B_DKE]